MADSKGKTFEEQIYDEDGHLTYEGAKRVIAETGGSVLINTAIITHHDNLPTQAQFAGADAKKQAQAREALLAQQAQINAQLATLGSQKTAALTEHKGNVTDVTDGGPNSGDTIGAAKASK